MDFKDKIVIVTGAASGIGERVAHSFAEQGAKVVVADINESQGLSVTKQISDGGGEAIFVKCDVSKFEDVQNLMETTVLTYERIDIAMNNAGIGMLPARTIDHDHKAFDKVMDVNCKGVFYCMQLEIKQMLKQGGGSIINTSSIAGLRGLPNNIAYVASKHAVVGMTKTAAMEYARNNIRINALCPVFTVTPLFNPEQMDKVSEGISEKLKKGIPMKRFSTTQEMADATLWLASDKASFVTGHALPIDGGLTA